MILSTLLFLKTPGAFMLVGGGSTTKEIVEKFASLCGGKSGRVIVLGQTREDPEKADSSAEMLKERGFTDILVVKDKIFSPERLATLEIEFSKADAFWVPGGDQNLVISRFGQKWIHENVDKAIKRGANWFGTSAGAMVVSDPMIGGNLPNGDPKIVPGAGLVDALVDTHFRVRNREQRLRTGFFRNKHQMGIGLDEGEWIIMRDNQIEDQGGSPKIILREN